VGFEALRVPTAAGRPQRLREVLHSIDACGARPAAGGYRSRGIAGTDAVDRCGRTERTGANGELIPLTKQDQAPWDQKQIGEGIALLTAALSKGSVGPYQLQAAIADLHDEAACAEDTDWPQILALYDLLKRMADNPMVTLNHAVATAMVHGPAAGLGLLDALEVDGRLACNHRIDAVRAHLLELTGDFPSAIEHYRIAAGRTSSLPERNYLTTQPPRLRERARSTE